MNQITDRIRKALLPWDLRGRHIRLLTQVPLFSLSYAKLLEWTTG
jgi:hypothetical protein